MRQRGAVAEADEAVDDGARVHDDVDLLVRDVEEEVRLDQLQALVRERRRVDRDLRPHRPGRVRECLVHAHCFELRERSVSERAAGSGEDERVDGLGARPSRHWKTAECSLSTGSSSASAPLPGGDREIACGDEALLVRERERDAALERPQGRADAGEADHGVQDEIGLGRLEELGQVAADLDVLDPVGRRRARRAAASRTRARRSRDPGAAPRSRVPAARWSRWPRAARSA